MLMMSVQYLYKISHNYFLGIVAVVLGTTLTETPLSRIRSSLTRLQDPSLNKLTHACKMLFDEMGLPMFNILMGLLLLYAKSSTLPVA
jgi:hypothetical protein